ncbi:D-glycero-alpha-D-manno-heptose-1,7-bisphosphate 7-phosphatase [Streptomyces tricolor]|uniref:D-glycero-alpha-D-manno-heptose-1,7-bisphosphate 7-phosphatase n=1 Tax=Streptomyces tricolor TaxID=68277 RepID=UPI0036EEE7E9
MNRLSAVLFDRDGTLVVDVPYNGDPDRVRLLPGAAAAVALARSHGLATGVVSNQSGIGRGLLTAEQVRRVNARADDLLGGLDTWVFCPHAPDAGCACRKPRPGLILTAAARLGVPPDECLVIGDIAADVLAARAAGARGVLIPNAATAPAEVRRFATESAPDPLTAVRAALIEAGARADRRPLSPDRTAPRRIREAAPDTPPPDRRPSVPEAVPAPAAHLPDRTGPSVPGAEITGRRPAVPGAAASGVRLSRSDASAAPGRTPGAAGDASGSGRDRDSGADPVVCAPWRAGPAGRCAG